MAGVLASPTHSHSTNRTRPPSRILGAFVEFIPYPNEAIRELYVNRIVRCSVRDIESFITIVTIDPDIALYELETGPRLSLDLDLGFGVEYDSVNPSVASKGDVGC